jgi:murein L,D-transpeptidase YcbB/YkuD
MADLCAGEKRSVLIKMRIRTVSPGRTSPGSVTVTYHDCFTGRPGVFSADLFIEGTSDSAAADASAHPAVIAEAALIEADDEHERYVRQYEKGERARAEKNIDRLTSRIQDINATLNDVRLAKKIEALHMESREMDEGDRSAAARSRYLKSAKQKLYYAKKGKRGKYVMRQGDKSHDVIRLQKKLTELNHYAGPVDGHFTARLDQAVKDFQTAHGLEPDGIAGPRTLKELGLY